MRIILGDTDITKYIKESSYNVNAQNIYMSWQDGFMTTHKVVVRKQIKGTFTMSLAEALGMTSQDFLALLEQHTTDGLTVLTLWVSNMSKMESIECYVECECTAHQMLADGTYLDTYKITIEES